MWKRGGTRTQQGGEDIDIDGKVQKGEKAKAFHFSQRVGRSQWADRIGPQRRETISRDFGGLVALVQIDEKIESADPGLPFLLPSREKKKKKKTKGKKRIKRLKNRKLVLGVARRAPRQTHTIIVYPPLFRRTREKKQKPPS